MFRILFAILLLSYPLHAQKLEEYTIHIIYDDYGYVKVNGQHIGGTPKYPVPATMKANLRKGDIVSAYVGNRGGDMSAIIEIYKGNQRVAGIENFVYTVAATPDWETTANLEGGRKPRILSTKGMAAGPSKNPDRGLPIGQDAKFRGFHLKYIVP